LQQFLKDGRGGIAVPGAIVTMVLTMAVGASLNMARAGAAATELQDLADSAAVAAAMVARDPGSDLSDMQATATALQRGVTAGAPGTKATLAVAVERRTPAKITVTATQAVPIVFGEFFGKEELVIERKATAEVGAARPICVLLLEPSAAAAWMMSGSASVRATDCLAQVNSRASGAISVGGSAWTRMLDTHVAGPASTVSGFRPAPLFNQKVLADPFVKKVVWPSASGGCAAANQNRIVTDSQTLKPGDYCGGLSFEGTNINLGQGTYVIKTGSLNIGSNAEVKTTGGGVTFVLLDPLATVTMRGNVSLTAPRRGAWRGIAVAVKPQPTQVVSRLTGGGGMQIDGALYLPTQRMITDGNNSSLPGRANLLVARSLEMSGTSNLTFTGDAGLLVADTPPVWLAR
jgi:Flp pilus assembly protein TadG